MSKYQRIGIIVCIIVAISLAIGFAWRLSQPKPQKEELLPEEKVAPSEEKIIPTGGGGGASAPIAIPCLVLDEEYCKQGKPLYSEEKKIVGLGFNLPEGTKIYAPFDGSIDNSLAAKIFDGVYYGFEILERGQQEQRNYFTVLGEVKTTIKPVHPVFSEEPERLANDPVQKKQLVAETTGEGKQRIITPAGNYDIVIYFMTYDTAKNIWSHNVDLLRQYFPYVKE